MKKAPGAVVSSSPGRDKLPPPPPDLTHLLSRKAAASRSRGRSAAAAAARSSPMFVVSRSRARGQGSVPAPAASEDGEPSSPKVTCIGQVRMRSKRLAPKPKMPKSAPLPNGSILAPYRCCLCRALLCGLFPPPALPKRTTVAVSGGGRGSLWRKWVRIRLGGSGWYRRRKADPMRPPASPELVRHERVTDRDEGEAGAAASHEEETTSFVPTSAAPPKNALLLMRCRSAPHNRASSLATGQLAMPPLRSPEPLDAEPSEKPQQEAKRRSIGNGPLVPELEAAAAGAEINDDEEEDREAKGSESQRPLVLPRSKSEPAGRTSGELALPEASYCFWTSNRGGDRRRRSGSEERQEAPSLSQ